jgi:hypothetical protein
VTVWRVTVLAWVVICVVAHLRVEELVVGVGVALLLDLRGATARW